jgi:hypothetical protein
MLLKCHKQFEGVIKKMGKTGLMKVPRLPDPKTPLLSGRASTSGAGTGWGC